MYLVFGIIISLLLAFFFDIKTNNLISFYSMILPFVLGLIIGIKSLMFVINKDDNKDEKNIKNNLNTMSEDIFKRLYFFFIISLVVFFVLVLKVDTNNVLIQKILQYSCIIPYIEITDYTSNLIVELVIFLSFYYFILVLVDIFTIMKETINLNNLKNKINRKS